MLIEELYREDEVAITHGGPDGRHPSQIIPKPVATVRLQRQQAAGYRALQSSLHLQEYDADFSVSRIISTMAPKKGAHLALGGRIGANKRRFWDR